jgi:hypothetical protein
MCFNFFARDELLSKKTFPTKDPQKHHLGRGRQYKIDFVSYLFFNVYQLIGKVFQLFEVFNYQSSLFQSKVSKFCSQH